MATIIPSVALVRRLIPAFLIEAAVLAVCVLGWVQTESLGWFAVIFVSAIATFAWVLYVIFTHRSEWRWYDGTPGAPP